MRRFGKVLLANGTPLLEQVSVADTFWTRFLGLMGRRKLDPSEGLLLEKTSSIHTCFMRFPIQVVYLDAEGRVLRLERVKPWRMGALVKGTKQVLELSDQQALPLSEGDRIQFICEKAVPNQRKGAKDDNV